MFQYKHSFDQQQAKCLRPVARHAVHHAAPVHHTVHHDAPVHYTEVKEVINNDYCFDSVLTICEETNTVVQRYLHLHLREGGHCH